MKTDSTNFKNPTFSSKKFSFVKLNFVKISSIIPKFRKKLMMQFQENARTERWKDGQILFHRTLMATAGAGLSSFSLNIFTIMLQYKH